MERDLYEVSQFISAGIGFSCRDQKSFFDQAAQISVDRGPGQAELFGGLPRDGVREFFDRSKNEIPYGRVLAAAASGCHL